MERELPAVVIGRVNQTIAATDDSTRQNAALVEEAAAAAMALQDRSARLAQVVSAFRLEEQGRQCRGARMGA